jgi:hypothetical protein
VTDAALTAIETRQAWRAIASQWNRRISIAAALITALVVFLFTWALAIRVGGWFGTFLGWWPAMLIASALSYVIGRAWHALLLAAAVAIVIGGPGVVVGKAAAKAAAFVGDHRTIADPQDRQPPTAGKSG